MAPKSSGTGSTARAATGLVPLAIALIAGNALVPGTGSKVISSDPTAPAKCEEGIENTRECHSGYPTGCSPTGQYDGYLNFLKNQHPPRDSKPVRFLTSLGDYQDLESRTPKQLGKENHLDLKTQLEAMGEGQPHAVVGYLYYAKQQGAESTNCELTAPDDTDFHIGIGFDKAVAASAVPHAVRTAADRSALTDTAVVVEMSPQYRADFAPEWTLPELHSVIGKQVKVVGQLMADNEHYALKDDCGLPGHLDSCWRASIWELHPVTGFQFCTLKDAECTPNGPGWADLGTAATPPAAPAPSSPPQPH